MSPDVAKVQTRRRTTPAVSTENAPEKGNAPTRNRMAARIPTYPSQRGNGFPFLVTNPYTAKPAANTRKPNTSTAPKPMTAWAAMTAAVLETPTVAYAPESTSRATASPMNTTAVTKIPTMVKRVALPIKTRFVPLNALRSPMRYGIANTAASPMRMSPAMNAVRKELNPARVLSASAGVAGKLYEAANVATRRIAKRTPEKPATRESDSPGLPIDEAIAAISPPRRGMIRTLLKGSVERRAPCGDQEKPFHANRVTCRCRCLVGQACLSCLRPTEGASHGTRSHGAPPTIGSHTPRQTRP